MNKREPSEYKLRILPFYTGCQSLEEALKHAPSRRLLWIESLLNGDFQWEKYTHLPEVAAAHEKACIWYGHFKTMVDGHVGRTPLEIKPGCIDEKEFRTFLEALNFVSD